jgi:hypothetical protein
MVLSKEQIEHELEVIEKIDRRFLRGKERSPLDIVGYEARQLRKRDLLRIIPEANSKE